MRLYLLGSPPTPLQLTGHPSVSQAHHGQALDLGTCYSALLECSSSKSSCHSGLCLNITSSGKSDKLNYLPNFSITTPYFKIPHSTYLCLISPSPSLFCFCFIQLLVCVPYPFCSPFKHLFQDVKNLILFITIPSS